MKRVRALYIVRHVINTKGMVRCKSFIKVNLGLDINISLLHQHNGVNKNINYFPNLLRLKIKWPNIIYVDDKI
jgi:hypothetical protein